MSNSSEKSKRIRRKSSGQAKEADPVLLREVLQLVESSPYSRHEIGGLDSLCFKGAHSSFFPLDKRHGLRRRWDELRRLQIINYHQFLLDKGIAPGATTLQELDAVQKRNSSLTKNKNTEQDFGEEEEDDNEEEEDTVAFLSDAFEDLDLVSSPSTGLFTTPPRSSLRTTNLQSSLPTTSHTLQQLLHERFSPCPQPSLLAMDNPPPTIASLTGGGSGLSISTGGSSLEVVVEGTKANPFRYVQYDNVRTTVQLHILHDSLTTHLPSLCAHASSRACLHPCFLSNPPGSL